MIWHGRIHFLYWWSVSLQTLNCLTDVKNQWLYCSLVKERNHSFNSCWREGEQWLVSGWSLIFCHWQCLSWHSVMTVSYIMNTHGSYFSNCCWKRTVFLCTHLLGMDLCMDLYQSSLSLRMWMCVYGCVHQFAFGYLENNINESFFSTSVLSFAVSSPNLLISKPFYFGSSKTSNYLVSTNSRAEGLSSKSESCAELLCKWNSWANVSEFNLYILSSLYSMIYTPGTVSLVICCSALWTMYDSLHWWIYLAILVTCIYYI